MTYARGASLVIAAALLWSLMGLCIRLIGEASVWQILFWRSLGILPVVGGLLLWRHGSLRAPITAAGLPGLLGGAGIAISFCGAVYAIESTTLANAVFLFTAGPFFAAVLGWLVLGERVRATTWAAIAVAGFGVVLMVREGLAIGAGAGNIAALISALGFAVMTLAMRARPRADPAVPVLLGGVFCAAGMVPVIVTLGQAMTIAPQDTAIAVAMGAIILGAGLALYSAGSRALPTADMALLSMLEVLLGPIWVWLFLSESASSNTLIGGAVLLAALAFNAVAASRAPPSPSRATG
jgi:drug/metabolite transporter (DMT)-like permease